MHQFDEQEWYSNLPLLLMLARASAVRGGLPVEHCCVRSATTVLMSCSQQLGRPAGVLRTFKSPDGPC
jgi:hypothetical protein